MEFISVGPFCDCVEIIGFHNLRKQSYPFDYIFSSLEMVKHAINDRFNIFLDKQYYKATSEHSMHHLFYSKMIDSEVLRIHHSNDGFIDIANNLENREIFLHHNLIYEDVYEAFVRRCNRLLNLIDNNNKIVFVYYNRYTDDFNDVLDFSNYFSDNKNIYVVGIFQKDKRMMRENVTSNDNKMLYESSNCKIYQNYNSEFIFNDITNKIMS